MQHVMLKYNKLELTKQNSKSLQASSLSQTVTRESVMKAAFEENLLESFRKATCVSQS